MMPTMLGDKTVVARKPHLCQTCDAIAVEKGQEYRRVTYAFDGTVYVWVQCEACRSLEPAITDWVQDYHEGISRDDYHEWAREHEHDENPNGDAARAYLARVRVPANQTIEVADRG
jgi:hypothetical protein